VAGSAGVAGTTSSGGAGGSGSVFPAGVTKPRIMIVGDSISAGPGCYKKYLLKNLTDNHYSSFEFVGQYTDDCGGNVKHSAVSCSTAAQYTLAMFTMPNCAQDKTFPGLSTLMVTHKPDLLMLQLGVNDVWGGKPTEETLGNYQKLVEQARAQNPKVVIAIAKIQKIRPGCGTDDSVQKRAEALVTALPAWAQKLSTAASPMFVADLWTNSDWSMAETSDCVHPNDAGALKMGANWYNTLKTILKPD
jgi:lysophospholipase L1-like esterase